MKNYINSRIVILFITLFMISDCFCMDNEGYGIVVKSPFHLSGSNSVPNVPVVVAPQKQLIARNYLLRVSEENNIKKLARASLSKADALECELIVKQSGELHLLASKNDGSRELIDFLRGIRGFVFLTALIDKANLEGKTALHIAVEQGMLRNVLNLLCSGADYKKADAFGHSPAEYCDLATEQGRWLQRFFQMLEREMLRYDIFDHVPNCNQRKIMKEFSDNCIFVSDAGFEALNLKLAEFVLLDENAV